MHHERVLSIGRREFLANVAKIGRWRRFRATGGLREGRTGSDHRSDLHHGPTATTGPSPQASAAAAPLRGRAGWEPGRHRPERPG